MQASVVILTSGHAGLFIKPELIAGRTHKCETFDNEPLSDSEDFEIMKLEVPKCYVR